MSQRHQSRRRRSYGRRQHEVRERRGRRDVWPPDTEPESEHESTDATAASFGDLFAARFQLAEGT
jgi:hypothetical protein